MKTSQSVGLRVLHVSPLSIHFTIVKGKNNLPHDILNQNQSNKNDKSHVGEPK